MIGVSAFGITHTSVSKSQLADGKYKPASELGHKDRMSVVSGVVHHQRDRAAPAKPQGDRSLHAVYRKYGYGRPPQFGAPSSAIDFTHEMKEASVPSPVHRHIRYGASVDPKHHAALDRTIDPHLARKLRHDVVIHSDPSMDGADAAAIGAHVTTGNRGHITLGKPNPAARTEGGGAAAASHAKDVVNHELVHASSHGINPINTNSRQRRIAGEEGRADALSNTDTYIKGGTYTKSSVGDGIHAKLSTSKLGRKLSATIRQVGGPPTDDEYYHRARRLVLAARKVK